MTESKSTKAHTNGPEDPKEKKGMLDESIYTYSELPQPGPDLDEKTTAKSVRERCRDDFRYFTEKYLMIVNKSRQLQPLTFNPVQEKYHAEKTDFDIILKARKVGITTYKCAEYFHNTIFVPNTITTIIAHNLDTTIEIFEKIKLFYEKLPDELKPGISRSNRRELVFTHAPDGTELNSKYSVGTAGNVEFARGKDIDNLHLSEYAFYRDPEKIKTGAMQALRTGGRVSIESTANGFNDFRDEWQKAKDDGSVFAPHFFPWFDDTTCSLSHTSLEKLTDTEAQMKNRYALSDDQIMWYRQKKKHLGEMIRQEYPFNDAEAFLSSTRSVFDVETLRKLMGELHGVQPIRAAENGRLKIWKEPVHGRTYTAGADCSEGIAGGDYSCCIIIDAETCRQVAELHGHWPIHIFANKCEKICKTYNSALLAVERNNHGHTVLNILRNQLNYPNLYEYRDYDSSGVLRKKLGWETNVKSKPIMIDELARGIAEKSVRIRSTELVKECMTYVYNGRGGMGAEAGCRDDRVMAMAIAIQARKSRIFAISDFNMRNSNE